MKDIVITIVMLLSFLGAIWYFLSNKYKRIRANWKFLSETYKLTPEFPKTIWHWAWGDRPHALGKMGTIPTRFDTIHRGSSDVRTYSRARFTLLHPREDQIQIHKANFLSVLGQKLGIKDTSLGNPVFDKEFVVHAEDAVFVKQILTAEIQEMLLEKSPLKARYWLRNGKFNVEISQNDLRSEGELKSYMDALAISHKIAAAIEKESLPKA